MSKDGKHEQLRKMRRIAGLSQYELAGLSGLARNRISLFECGYVQLRDEEYSLAERTIQDVLMKKFRTAMSKDETAVQ
jgi:transcriptional regulator with XRE-family HTH domain